MPSYDVIFTDAGSSGSNANEKYAISGLKMILPEKKNLPREKPSSGMFSQPIRVMAGI